MAATFKTQYGTVTASKPYFSFIAYREVIDITLIPFENEESGWGVSRSFHPETELTPEFFNTFAKEAAEILT